MKSRMSILSPLRILLAGMMLAACVQQEAVEVPEEELPGDGGIVAEDVTERPGAGITITATADIPETRTHITMNDLGTSAGVYWSAGDKFSCLYIDENNDNKFSRAVFTTEDDNVKSATFSTVNEVPDGKALYCSYPSGGLKTNSSAMIFGKNLPAEQTAVAGGVAEGLLFSTAYAANLNEDFTFHNIPCLIRFRISGSVAGSVTKITFMTSTQIAGDFIFTLGTDGIAVLDLDRHFSGAQPYDTITLTGTFVEGQDYYIAVLPVTVSGFDMVFSDASGNSTTKSSTKTMEFKRSKILDFGTIALGDSFEDAPVTSYAPIKYMESTRGTKPVVLAVVPDGFTAPEMGKFVRLAEAGIDALFDTEPYKTYKDYFRVWFLRVDSNESGASVLSDESPYGYITERDCYFKSRWEQTQYNRMACDATTLYGFVENNCPDILNGTHTIDEIPVLVIINDSRYGGICHFDSNRGRAYCMAPYSFNGGQLGWRYPSIEAAYQDQVTTEYVDVSDADIQAMGISLGDWTNTLVHEYGGHAFARLADEYWYENNTKTGGVYSGYTVPFGLNLTGDYTSIPWQHWLDRKATLVTSKPQYDRIGIYQGGQVAMSGRWRNERTSCMIDNRFYFSAWQRELIVKRILTLSGDIGTFDFDTFLTTDDPTDPLRDVAASPILGKSGGGEIHYVPMLPPPVFD